MSSRRRGVSLPCVKSFLSGAAVLAFFAAINVVAALTMLCLGMLLPNELREEPMAWMVVGVLGIVACLAFAAGVLRIIGSRPVQDLVHARATPRPGATTSPGRTPSSSGS